MKQLSEFKQEVAQDKGYDNWNEVLGCEDWEVLDYLIHRYAIAYSKNYFNQAIEKAAENAQMIVHDGHNKTNSYSKHIQMGVNNAQIDKESILNLKVK